MYTFYWTSKCNDLQFFETTLFLGWRFIFLTFPLHLHGSIVVTTTSWTKSNSTLKYFSLNVLFELKIRHINEMRCERHFMLTLEALAVWLLLFGDVFFWLSILSIVWNISLPVKSQCMCASAKTRCMWRHFHKCPAAWLSVHVFVWLFM